MGSGVAVSPDQVSVGVLVSSVPWDVVDVAVAAHGVGAKRSGGTLPPHVVAYLTMGLCLFSYDDYEEVAVKVTGSLSRFWVLGRFLAELVWDHAGAEAAGPGGDG